MRFLLALAVSLTLSGGAFAMAIDVSNDVIRVTTGFTGTSLTVFGTQDKPGSVVIVVEGPPKTITVRRKSRVLGFWTNTDTRRFLNVPAFYEVAASGPIEQITTRDVLRQNRIGVSNLNVVAAKGGAVDETTAAFTAALFSMQQQEGLFVSDVASLAYPGPMLFKAQFTMPTTVAPGQYKVSAYLFQDGQIIEEDSIPFIVVPEGLSAQMRDFATENGLLYGLTGMLLALFAGWLATVMLKRE